jgi:hypothetical protein
MVFLNFLALNDSILDCLKKLIIILCKETVLDYFFLHEIFWFLQEKCHSLS